ncbi:Mom family adenine methylcarbamoylation protein [Phytohabitans houttuyneae]|uniref:Uncharacterized protein n=1 Tax=Phytohabitans houttuyneae TaxID=1076126 RepID=A0A6V8KU06_9ACTN|nr:hypothetical protein [Phytohabitans houttuyneae]GFJ85789.1 hypothetical protein Phou_099690 [Phytohabitans houttuyneae]
MHVQQLSLFEPQLCQRWRTGRHTWRPVHEGGFDARRYRLVQIPEAAARAFVVQHHYSRSFPAARASFGLLEGEHLVGVAVVGVPMHPRVLTNPFPTLDVTTAAELSRLVLLDDVPSNAESFVMGRLFRLTAEHGLRGLVAFADPQPRIIAGTMVLGGHLGHVYRVTRGRYLGRGTARTLTVLPDGTVLTARAQSKVRRAERGAAGVRARLVGLGAHRYCASVPPDGWNPTPDAPAWSALPPLRQQAAWLEHALAAVGARRVRHLGCHRFAWPVGDRGWRRRCPIGVTELPYPIAIDPAVTL